MLRIPIRPRPRKTPAKDKLSNGPEGRINRLRSLVTGLVRYERIEGVYQHCDETRGYAEMLIHTALRNGSKHQPTVDMADFWLKEKDLIYKLFDVLVPRYEKYSTAFTDLYRLPTIYPGSGKEMGILELKGNPWPDVLHKKRDTKYLISNVLLREARKEYYISNESSEKK